MSQNPVIETIIWLLIPYMEMWAVIKTLFSLVTISQPLSMSDWNLYQVCASGSFKRHFVVTLWCKTANV